MKMKEEYKIGTIFLVLVLLLFYSLYKLGWETVSKPEFILVCTGIFLLPHILLAGVVVLTKFSDWRRG